MGGRERGKDGMPHERENTRTGREKSFHSFISYRVGIVSLIWKPHIPVLAPPSPSLQAYSMSISSHLKTLLFLRCAEVSEQRSTSHTVSRGPEPYASSTPTHPSAPPSSPLLQANLGLGGRGDLSHWTATADSVVSAMD
jgi:hypothetical protein